MSLRTGPIADICCKETAFENWCSWDDSPPRVPRLIRLGSLNHDGYLYAAGDGRITPLLCMPANKVFCILIETRDALYYPTLQNRNEKRAIHRGSRDMITIL
jgi:hypothetical protein